MSISKCYLFQKARSNFEDAIASFILVIMEFLHHSFERNRVLGCEEDHKNGSNMIEFEQAVNDSQHVIFEVEFIRGAPFLQRISIVLFIGSIPNRATFPRRAGNTYFSPFFSINASASPDSPNPSR